MTVTAIIEFTTDEIDKSDLSMLEVRARGMRNYHKGGGEALHVERQVSGPARRTLPTHRPNGSHTQTTDLTPFAARASVSDCVPLLTHPLFGRSAARMRDHLRASQ